MRALFFALLLPTLSHAQFELFGGRNYEDTANSISDVVGMRDAIGVWGKMFRNLATGKRIVPANKESQPVRPQHVDVTELKSIPKGNGEIINEKLLNMLLPRIKGQPAFTTTTLATTTTTSTTTASTTTKTTTTPEPSTTNAPESTTAEATSTTKAPETSTVLEKKTTTAQPEKQKEEKPVAEEKTDDLPLIAKPGNPEGPQFTVVFRTADKTLLEKKSNVEVVDFNQDKEEVKEKETTVKVTTEKTAEVTTQKTVATTTESATTAEATTIKVQEEIDLRRALMEKFDDDEDFKGKRKEEKEPTTETTTKVTTTAPKTTNSESTTAKTTKAPTTTMKPEQKKDEKKKETEKKEEVKETPKKKEEEKKTDDKKKEAAKKKQKGEEKKVAEKKEEKKEKTEEKKTNVKKPDIKVIDDRKKDNEKKTESAKIDKSEVKKDSEQKSPEEKKEQEKPKQSNGKKSENAKKEKEPTSKEIEAQIEKEATEILDLLNKPNADKRQEMSRKMLLEKLREYLSQQEMIKATEPPKASAVTTKAPSATTTTQATTKQAVETTTSSAPEVTETTAKTTEPAKEKETSTTEAPNEEAKSETEKPVVTKKRMHIPEAEEEESMPAFVQEDVHDTTTTVGPSTTTLTRATPAGSDSERPSADTQASSILSAGTNTDTRQISNVIAPITSIMDSISPILTPLFGGVGGARARSRGVRTYEPSGRDLMSDSTGETSLVGFGTQLAREILSPGSMIRERQAKEQNMAARIEEARQSRGSKSLLATVLDMAKTGRPLQLPIITTPPPQPSVFAPNVNNMQQIQDTGFDIAAARPPPGYQGPLAPLPPPPPPGFIPRGYTGTLPTTLSQNDKEIESAFVTGKIASPAPAEHDEGYQKGQNGVRATFAEDSGLQMTGPTRPQQTFPTMPSSGFEIAPASDGPMSIGSGGASGFGGGRKPSSDFNPRDLKMDNSFFTSHRRMRA